MIYSFSLQFLLLFLSTLHDSEAAALREVAENTEWIEDDVEPWIPDSLQEFLELQETKENLAERAEETGVIFPWENQEGSV